MNLEAILAYWPALVAFIALLMAVGVVYYLRSRRPSPAELERRRRQMIHGIGKMGDGIITELQGSLASYSYHVRGIEYLATQDLSGLEAFLPPEEWDIIGPVTIKYDPRNPANSIVISEKWSGLRKTSNSKVNS
jgi:hypothetical protein